MSNENEARVPAGSPEGGQWTTYAMSSSVGVKQVTTNEGPAKAEAMLLEQYKFDVSPVKHVNSWPAEQTHRDTVKPGVFHKDFTSLRSDRR